MAAKTPEGEEGLCLFGPPARRDRLCRMVYRGGAVPFPEGIEPLRGDALLAMYETVGGPGVRSENTERRYVIRMRAINAGLAETFAVCEDGSLASTASVVAVNDAAALIGDVYTVYAYRFQGYATRLTEACVAHALRQDLTPALYCEKQMKRFYRRMGFR